MTLAATLRAALSVQALDPAHGPTMIAFPRSTIEHVITALDAANATIPWIGNDHVREQLEETLGA